MLWLYQSTNCAGAESGLADCKPVDNHQNLSDQTEEDTADEDYQPYQDCEEEMVDEQDEQDEEGQAASMMQMGFASPCSGSGTTNNGGVFSTLLVIAKAQKPPSFPPSPLFPSGFLLCSCGFKSSNSKPSAAFSRILLGNSHTRLLG